MMLLQQVTKPTRVPIPPRIHVGRTSAGGGVQQPDFSS